MPPRHHKLILALPMLPQFIEVGRLLTMRRHADMADSASDGGAALDIWTAPFGETKARGPKSADPPRLAPVIRRKRRAAANVGPGRQIIRRGRRGDAPERPEDWRRKAIAAAWAARDWWTLKAFGEIDEVPEP